MAISLTSDRTPLVSLSEAKDLPRPKFTSAPKQILRFAQEDSERTAFARRVTPSKVGISENEITAPPVIIHPHVSFRRKPESLEPPATQPVKTALPRPPFHPANISLVHWYYPMKDHAGKPDMNHNADDTPQEEIRDTLTPFEAYDAVPLCPTCFNETGEDWEFCPTCYAPLGPFVGYDPLQYIYTMRFLIYQGVTRPTHPIIVIGLLLFYTSNIFFYLFVGHSIYESVIEIALFVLYATLYCAVCIWSIYLLLRNALILTMRTKSEK